MNGGVAERKPGGAAHTHARAKRHLQIWNSGTSRRGGGGPFRRTVESSEGHPGKGTPRMRNSTD